MHATQKFYGLHTMKKTQSKNSQGEKEENICG